MKVRVANLLGPMPNCLNPQIQIALGSQHYRPTKLMVNVKFIFYG